MGSCAAAAAPCWDSFAAESEEKGRNEEGHPAADLNRPIAGPPREVCSNACRGTRGVGARPDCRARLRQAAPASIAMGKGKASSEIWLMQCSVNAMKRLATISNTGGSLFMVEMVENSRVEKL